ncbi:MAG TPA: acetylornithine/succinylornithine family transaminase [Herpetosiphonaceae bacterium]|nr:acetylornithine/succinylornithine family transaminase [Herpetosiphonaceae bacterium]
MTAVVVSEYQALEQAHGIGVYAKRPVTIVRGEGCTVWDEHGRTYLDCASGYGVANLGHCHPAVVAAIQEQAARLLSCPETLYNDQRASLLRELAAVLPAGLERIFLSNSGAEAIEAALKLARASTGRDGLVAAMRGFHGRTFGALSATWESHYREPFVPLVPGFSHIPYNNLDALEAAVGVSTAAVLLEIVQGEGGVRPGDAAFLRGAQALCRERGALLIVDEIQTGMGRTGRLFAVEHHGLEPDILVLAKALGGGMPIGATAFGPRAGTFTPGMHGSTFGGNPLAAAAARAALRATLDADLPAHAERLGAGLLERLRRLPPRRVREVRGVGLMIGIELREKAAPLLRALLERGIIALPAGPSVIRLLPPLVITVEELDHVADVLEGVLSAGAHQ